MSAAIEQLEVEADPMLLAGVRPQSAAARDWQIIRWVGRIGVVTIDQLQARFGLGRTVAYRRSPPALRRACSSGSRPCAECPR